jgi:hypothetical protein
MLRMAPNIEIDGDLPLPRWNPNRYEAAVQSHLQRAFDSGTGQAIRRQLTQRLRIVPNYLTPGEFNAYTLADDPSAALPPGALPRNCETGTVLTDRARGTGGGSAVTILFTPAVFVSRQRYLGVATRGNAPDEVLLHEMVHAMRDMHGLTECRPIGGRLRAYDNVSEFYAITIANVYCSERNRPLVGGHSSRPPSMPFTRSFLVMYPDAARYLDGLFREQPVLCDDMLQIKTPFNPLRDYYYQSRSS